MQLAGAGPEEQQVVGTRVCAAPRERVWRMWTEREHVASWWGPRGFRTTISTMDVRPGGVWELVLHGPDGRDGLGAVEGLE